MPTTPNARRRARELVVQAIYQWQLAGQDLGAIEAQFHTDNDMEKVDTDYFRDLFYKIARHAGELDQHYEILLDRRVDELDPVSRAILLLSTCELEHRLDVPYKVVLNEGINLAKKYGPTDSQKYINGVLDKLCPRLRKLELQAERNKRSAQQS